MDVSRLDLWPARRPGGRPSSIAHRGASAYRTENTLAAFSHAAALGADMWEIDLHLTADGVPVISHDASTAHVFGIDRMIAETTAADLAAAVPDLPTFRAVVDLARELDQALYVEVKARGAGRVGMALLDEWGFGAAVFGSFNHDEVRDMAAAGSRFPLSVLVRSGEDPFAAAYETGAGIVHLCWERAAPAPQTLVTPALLASAAEKELGVVLWHEERNPVLADLVGLPVLGICSNCPELVTLSRAELLAAQRKDPLHER
ncbi:glycerophosphodiester phosphodiesterase [Martelella endophytica]|uniref:glycerophosphodiester phosphodiesterase n=1 Tax=Martelella endophytica TaxID=1486262 RepID=UPI0005F1EDAD|nr:glycerophosphodiester phosphodiesterase [Martelella endophytica]